MTLVEERPSTAIPAARRAMIDSQLRVSGVNDPAILAAFAAVPREDFVPAGLKEIAYMDRALPLGEGHMLPAPLVHGLMLSEAALRADDEVLVVSPAGYLAALAATFGCRVTAASPAEAAGARKKDSFTVILVDGAIEQLPAALAARLAEGGRLVTGTLERAVSRLAAGRKAGADVALLPLAEIGIPPLPEFAAPQCWSF